MHQSIHDNTFNVGKILFAKKLTDVIFIRLLYRCGPLRMARNGLPAPEP